MNNTMPYNIPNPPYQNNNIYPNWQNQDIRNLENRISNLEREIYSLKNKINKLDNKDNYSSNYQPNSYNMM